MKKVNDGGPAFPADFYAGGQELKPFQGVTLRQWYAGMAISTGKSAREAFEIADAMIAYEEKEKQP